MEFMKLIVLTKTVSKPFPLRLPFPSRHKSLGVSARKANLENL